MRASERSNAMRVGVFLTVGMLVGALAIFAIGEKSGLFERKVVVYANFEDISGLVSGAPVRLAGLDVGTVSDIELPEKLEEREARVALSIKARYMNRVRKDSRAFIDSKGLLGDKIVNITLGTAATPELKDGDTIATRTSLSMESLANKVEDALASVTRVSQTADEAIGELAVGQVRTDIGRAVATTADILEQVKSGDGLVHRLLYDPRYAERVAQAIDETAATMARVGNAAQRLDRAVAAVESGPGTLHELIYGQDGVEAMHELRAAASELSTMMREVREGDGLAHALVYDSQGQQIVDDLHAVTQRIDRLTGDIEKGRGTLGGLVVDPSVYEDMKTLLGNVERNVALKALMRFAIKDGDIERPAHVPSAPPPEPAAPDDDAPRASAPAPAP